MFSVGEVCIAVFFEFIIHIFGVQMSLRCLNLGIAVSFVELIYISEPFSRASKT